MTDEAKETKAEKPVSIGDLFKDLLKDLIRSKKFIAFATGVIANVAVLAASKFGVSEEMATDAATKITGLVGTYVIGQGFADMGKEKAKLGQVIANTVPAAGVSVNDAVLAIDPTNKDKTDHFIG